MNPQIAVLGCGTMAGAIVSGLLAAGTDPSRIVATARSSATRQRVGGGGGWV
ncbi:NAD(P)-binding domain-containing protein, partial [Acidipropionibacterium jensenii]|uniref:NAD(P)-binding domain-containing protein n=1 Tax=Acidipropionibacterium jensenii TaxID=1749 RepID=UPI002648173A